MFISRPIVSRLLTQTGKKTTLKQYFLTQSLLLNKITVARDIVPKFS